MLQTVQSVTILSNSRVYIVQKFYKASNYFLLVRPLGNDEHMAPLSLKYIQFLSYQKFLEMEKFPFCLKSLSSNDLSKQ